MELHKNRREYFLHLFIQAIAAFIFMWLVLFSLDLVATSRILWAAGASTLASSSFIIFCSPQSVMAKPQKIIGGYIIAMVCGEVMRWVAIWVCHIIPSCHAGPPFVHVFEVAAALSLVLALLLMILFRSEHPPAAGLAIVMVLDVRNLDILAVILAAAVLLSIVQMIFRKKLCNLI